MTSTSFAIFRAPAAPSPAARPLSRNTTRPSAATWSNRRGRRYWPANRSAMLTIPTRSAVTAWLSCPYWIPPTSTAIYKSRPLTRSPWPRGRDLRRFFLWSQHGRSCAVALHQPLRRYGRGTHVRLGPEIPVDGTIPILICVMFLVSWVLEAQLIKSEFLIVHALAPRGPTATAQRNHSARPPLLHWQRSTRPA